MGEWNEQVINIFVHQERIWIFLKEGWMTDIWREKCLRSVGHITYPLPLNADRDILLHPRARSELHHTMRVAGTGEGQVQEVLAFLTPLAGRKAWSL